MANLPHNGILAAPDWSGQDLVCGRGTAQMLSFPTFSHIYPILHSPMSRTPGGLLRIKWILAIFTPNLAIMLLTPHDCILTALAGSRARRTRGDPWGCKPILAILA